MEDEIVASIPTYRRIKQRDLVGRLVKIVDATVNHHDDYGEYVVAYYEEGASLSSFVVAGKQPINQIKQLLVRDLFPVTVRMKMIVNPYDSTRQMWRMAVVEHHNSKTKGIFNGNAEDHRSVRQVPGTNE